MTTHVRLSPLSPSCPLLSPLRPPVLIYSCFLIPLFLLSLLSLYLSAPHTQTSPHAALDFPLDEPAVLPSQPRVKLPVRSQRKDRTLICGWRRDIDDMISSLDAEVKEGSELHLLCELTIEEREQRLFNGNMGELKNLKLVHHVGNPAVRRVLEALPLASYHYVLVLADGEKQPHVDIEIKDVTKASFIYAKRVDTLFFRTCKQ
jgi:hypothetical protein